jgi:hypothetical protein
LLLLLLYRILEDGRQVRVAAVNEDCCELITTNILLAGRLLQAADDNVVEKPLLILFKSDTSDESSAHWGKNVR